MNQLLNTKVWEEFYKKSEKLSKPTSIDCLISDEDVVELQQQLKTVINKFLDKGELHKGIKVYINHELNNAKVEEMASDRPRSEETIEQWSMRLFGDQKFGMVVNSLETFNNELTERMCTIVAPLLQKAGMPLGGLSFLFFMGNYGFTPFGIHKEAKGEEGFLFHLGPNHKDFYTWDIEEYNKIEHNTEVFHGVDAMLPTSKKYPLQPKSAMFIPHYVYHIANTDEFSLSIVMDYINPSRDYLEKKIAAQIGAEKDLHPDNKTYLPPVKIQKELNWEELLNQTTWANKYQRTLDKFITKLKSNAGVLNPSVLQNKQLPNPPFTISGKAIFPLLEHTGESSKTCVMARGNELQVKNNPKLTGVLNKLNSGETLSFQELQNHLAPDWDLIDLFDFVNQLWRAEAINIVE